MPFPEIAGSQPSQVQASPAQAAPAAVQPATPNPIADNRGPAGTPHPGSFEAPAAPAVAAAPPESPLNVANPEAAAVASQAAASGTAAQFTQGSARAIAHELGLQSAGQFGSDQEFMGALLQQANQAAVLQQQLQAVVQQQQQAAQLAQYQQQLAAQQQVAPQPAQPAAKAFWNPPEYQPAWEQMVAKDQNGNLTPLPGADPSIVGKLLTYQAYRRDFADRLLSNPSATLEPLIAQQAEAKAREIVQQEMRAQQEKSYIQGFVQQNAGWLHAHDAQGQVIVHPVTRQPILSPVGQRFQGYIQQAEQLGLRTAQDQEQYARTALQRDMAIHQYQGQTGRPEAQAAVAGANRQPNQAGTLPRPGIPAPAMPGVSLRDQLALAFRENGITDEQVNSDVRLYGS